MQSLYTLLFTLSIILINPWGTSRGQIWTLPKVAIVGIIVGVNLWVLCRNRLTDPPPSAWWQQLRLWTVFLGIGLVSTLSSPFPLRSFLGQTEMGDGWVYWLLVAAFVLTNARVVQPQPQLMKAQASGFLIGGSLLALSMMPQSLNWHLDYTHTSGQLLNPNLLVSTIFRNQQPIGLYSHRGHAAITLTLTLLLCCLSWRWRWFPTRVMVPMITLLAIGLWLSQTRMAVVALMAGFVYLFRIFRSRRPNHSNYYWGLILMLLLGLVVVGVMSGDRHLADLSWLKQITSDRIHLWQIALRGIPQRWLLGWGFDGFGIAYPYIAGDAVVNGVGDVAKITVANLGDSSFEYWDQMGTLHLAALPSNKAHNWILDTALSTGVLGLFTQVGLWTVATRSTLQSPYSGVEVIGLAYGLFTLMWFECAQFTHIAWWAMGLGMVSESVGGKRWGWNSGWDYGDRKPEG